MRLVWLVLLAVCYAVFVRGAGRRPHQLTDRTEPITVVPKR